MLLPILYESDIRHHYSKEWADNYTLKLYLLYKVICDPGGSVRRRTMARHTDEFVLVSCVPLFVHMWEDVPLEYR